jgi:hypothetical protein
MAASFAPSSVASLLLATGFPCRRICRATEKATHSNAQKLMAKARNKSRIEDDRAEGHLEA